MNWATIAPETRLYKGKELFKWEDSPGLEHHCGTCKTPLHNARAKTSCIGKHVEPCYRFHQQLHFTSKSHECFGCNSSDEEHFKRHREILVLKRQISAHDEEGKTTLSLPLTPPTGKIRRSAAAASTGDVSPNEINDTASEGPSVTTNGTPMTRRERKKAKKLGNNSGQSMRKDVESFTKEDLNFISEAIHLHIHESKGGWEGTYVYNTPEAIKEKYIEEEAEVTPEEAEGNLSSHHRLAVKGPCNLTPRQRKVIKTLSTPANHVKFSGGSQKFSSHSAVQKEDPFDGVDPAIFFRLGVEIVNPPRNSKVRKELANKLVTAVKEDLEIIEREERDTRMREEGFWRWAGKTGYHAIAEVREKFDWPTGQKKGTPRIEPYKYVDNEEITTPEIEDEDDLAVKPEIPPSPTPTPTMSKVKPSTKENVPPTAPKRQAPFEEAWETVGGNKPKNHKKKESISYKTLTTKMSNMGITDEDGAEDGFEMVQRHKQRIAGKSTIYKTDGDISTHTRKLGKVMTLNIR